MTPRQPVIDDAERELGRILETLLLRESIWLTWLEPESAQDRELASVGARGLFRGSESPPTAVGAAILCAVFDDPYVGAGAAWPAELSLDSDIDDAGAPGVRFRLRPIHGGPAEIVAWEGPVSGRLLLHDAVVDFTAEDGASLAHRDGVLLLHVSLGDDWLDRDETPSELLAAVHGILLLRER